MTRAYVDPPRNSSPSRGDAGSILPLVLFYGVLSLVLVVIAVAATSLYLDRKRLFTLADGAALVGAEAFDLNEVALTPDGPRIVLHNEDVAAAVREYVDLNAPDSLDDIRVERAETTDGSSAIVELSAYWRPPVMVLFVREGLRVEVTVVARSVVF